MRVANLIAALTEFCRRRAEWVLLAGLALAVLSATAAYLRLRSSADSEQFQGMLVAAVDAPVPEAAQETAAQLARALAADKQHFRSVTLPDASPYLAANALLFLEPKPLTEVLDHIIDAQPFLGQVAADPSARGLFAGLSWIAIDADKVNADRAPLAAALPAIHAALAQAMAGHPQPLSWQNLLGIAPAQQREESRLVLAQPAPGQRAAAIATLRTAAADLEFVRSGLAHAQYNDALHTENAIGTPLADPSRMEVLAPSPAEADAIAARLKALPLVRAVATLSSFVPEDQRTKLPLIADAATMLAGTLASPPPAAPVTADDIRLAARTALSQIDHLAPKLAKDDPLLAIGADLRALQSASDATLIATNAALTRFLPRQLERLRLALGAGPIDASAIPPEIARDWQLPDGRVRVVAVPKADVDLETFVTQVRSVAPDAGGPAVMIVERTTRITRYAVPAAVIGIGLFLALMLWRPLLRSLRPPA